MPYRFVGSRGQGRLKKKSIKGARSSWISPHRTSNRLHYKYEAQTRLYVSSFNVFCVGSTRPKLPNRWRRYSKLRLDVGISRSQFYKDALANFSDADFNAAGFAGIRDTIVEIGADEQTHADFLVGRLQPPEYTDELGALTTANISGL